MNPWRVREPRYRNSETDDSSTCSVKGRDLIYSGEIGDTLVVFLYENLLRFGKKLGEEPMAKAGRRLFINSFGGYVTAMASVVDLFEEIGDLTTIANGACMSATVPIVAAGTAGKRYATARTRFMTHPVGWESDVRFEPALLQVETKETLQSQKTYAEIMGRYSNMDAKWWLQKLMGHEPWYFSARVAKQYGIIDHIIGEE